MIERSQCEVELGQCVQSSSVVGLWSMSVKEARELVAGFGEERLCPSKSE